jgi:hypothetical protein
VNVGYPTSPNTKNATSIAKYYRLVDVDKQNFFSNILNASYVMTRIAKARALKADSALYACKVSYSKVYVRN